MDLTEQLDLVCEPAVLFAVVADLGRYPEWLGIVTRARVEEVPDGQAVWAVDLRGRLGPFARSKRLRMARTELDEPSYARFERRESDGRDHAPWILEVGVSDMGTPGRGPASRLRMRLHYGGSLWVPVLDRLLANEIERSKARLAQLVT